MDMFGIEEMSNKDLSFLDQMDYFLVDTEEKLADAKERIMSVEYIVLDTETEGLSPLHHKIVGAILGISEKESYYFPFRHKVGVNLPIESFILFFKEIISAGKKLILANGKFDWMMIYYQWHIDFEIFADILIEAYILNSDLAESKELALKPLTKKYLGFTPLELSDFGETNFSLFDPVDAYKYACPDGTSPYSLWKIFSKEIEEKQLQKVEQIELAIIKPIGRMQLLGIKIDTQVLKDQQDSMKARIEELEKRIWGYAGREFDLNSPKQMAEVFYDELKIEPLMKGKNPVLTVGADVLEELEGSHPIISAVINYRNVVKLYNDFVLKLPECLAEDGRLHSELNQTGTRSGRFSSSGGFGKGGQKLKVNLQQLPKAKGFEDEKNILIPPEKESLFDFDKIVDEEEVTEKFPDWEKVQEVALPSWKPLRISTYIKVKVRDAFVPSDGYVWVSADYSQLEYRALANLAHDESLINAFMSGIDFHTATASDMLGIPIDKVSKADRKIGKTINFGLVYGMTKWGLAKKLGVTPDEAQILMDKYFKNKPKIHGTVEGKKSEVKALKYVRTYFGRIRWFNTQLDEAQSYSQQDQVLKRGFNTYVQGSAADLAKIAFARVDEAIKPYGDKIRILSQVHDELNFEVHKSLDLQEVCKVIDKAMSFRGVVPGWADIPADIEIGECYGQLKDPKEYGVDMQKIYDEAEPTDVDLELFKPLDLKGAKGSNTGSQANVIFKSSKDTTAPQKREFKTRESLKTSQQTKKSVKTEEVKQSPPEVSAGQKMLEKRNQIQEGVKVARLDLSKAKFPISTIVIHKKADVADDEAYSALTKFIAANFGRYDLVIEYEGMLYKFPDQYRVADNITSIEQYFDVQIFKAAPKVKLTL